MGKELINKYFTKSPEEQIKETYKKIPNNMTVTFIVTFLFGMFVHLYVFTNIIVNHDSTMFLVSNKNTFIEWRWLIDVASSLSGIFQIPMVIGTLAIFFTSLSATFVIYILDIKSKLLSSFIGMAMMSFPVVACIFSYMYTADAYALALFLATLSVFFAKKKRWRNFFLSALLLMFSTAIYQAYCQFTLTLFVVIILLEVMKYEKSIKEIYVEGIKFCSIFVLGVVGYRVVLSIIFRVLSLDIKSPPLSIWSGFVGRLKSVYQLFVGNITVNRGVYGNDVVKWIYGIYLIFSIWLIVKFICKKEEDKWKRLIISAVLWLCIPIAQNILVIVTDTRVHNLTCYSFIISIVFFIKLVDMFEASIRSNMYKWLTISTSVIILWSNTLYTNECYYSLQLTDITSFALANRIVARIENTDGWQEDMPVIFVGNYSDVFDSCKDTKPLLHEKVGRATGILTMDYVYYKPYILYMFINDYIGKKLTQATESDLDKVKQAGIVEKMGDFPAENSAQVINGVMVVKLCDSDLSDVLYNHYPDSYIVR